jgi:hypothetical protein
LTDHIQRLMQLQEGSLKSSDDFHKQYDTVSHELALSEGLGKIYGAPRYLTFPTNDSIIPHDAFTFSVME